MPTLVLLRHGESDWNRENRFTGWTDVDLSETGDRRGPRGRPAPRRRGPRRSTSPTPRCSGGRSGRSGSSSTTSTSCGCRSAASWRLNERHYGALQGLDKAETAREYGDEQVRIWRRSYDVPPPALDPDDERFPGRDRRYAGLADADLPRSESLKDTVARFLPYWHDGDRAGRPVRPAGPHRGPRQQPAGPREVPRRRVRRGHRGPQHPDRRPARLRARRRPAAARPPLPRRRRPGSRRRWPRWRPRGRRPA